MEITLEIFSGILGTADTFLYFWISCQLLGLTSPYLNLIQYGAAGGGGGERDAKCPLPISFPYATSKRFGVKSMDFGRVSS